MNLKRLIFLCFIALSVTMQAQEWKIAGERITTTWGENVDPSNVHPEYPRPNLVRENNWKNLNGLWNYAITEKEAAQPKKFDGKILVPFAVESALSGVAKQVTENNTLWYQTTFKASASKGKRTILRFEAVDWRADVYLNGKHLGTHEGGFVPFSFDITDFMKGGSQDLVVKVWDPTNRGPQPRGKQEINGGGIWYTPVSGIWQTVWLETVPESYIVSTKQTPCLQTNSLAFSAELQYAKATDMIRVTAFDKGVVVDEKTVAANTNTYLNIKNPKLWTPDSPFLYDLKVELLRNGKVIDKVDSYFAMRSISMGKDANGIQRLLLNGEFVFQYGFLDQGWWPDGLHTAPSDEALVFDIKKSKEMGYNMIRKHIKVEPQRWYTHCDQIGMLVWQDMPSGDHYHDSKWETRPGIYRPGADKTRTAEAEQVYRKEWEEIMKHLHNYPSIVMWVPFNEAWGQFKTVEITEWTMQMDPSRVVNAASGGNFFPVGHIIDLHEYPAPKMPDANFFGEDYILILGEFGGLGLVYPDHIWQKDGNWGYQSFEKEQELQNKYNEFVNTLEKLIKEGLSGAVYTQTTDVEGETNGMMTYDRKVIKIPANVLNDMHKKLYNKNLVEMPK